MSNSPIKRISIHATDTQEGHPLDLVSLKKWHVERGFGGIGYHYVIGLQGDIHLTRNPLTIPCAVKGYNTGMIAIAYWGGMDTHGQPKDTRTPAQRAALGHLVALIAKRYGLSQRQIFGHRDLDYIDRHHDGRPEAHPDEWKKECPCFDVSKEVAGWMRDN